MLGALLQLTLAMGPSVAVEVSADRSLSDADAVEVEALRSWLVQRLIEEGVTIAPSPEQAERVVRLRQGKSHVVVETDHEQHAIEHGPVPVMRLEVLHRARLVIEESGPTKAASAPVGKVIGIRSAGKPPEGFAGVLESKLLSAGYVLTPDPRQGDPVLCVYHRGSEVAASMTQVDEFCGPGVVSVPYADLLTGGAAAIVRTVEGESTPADAPQSVELGKPEVTRTAIPPIANPVPETKWEKRVPWHQEDAEVRIGIGGGVAVRGAADGLIDGVVRMGMAPGPGARLAVSLMPSRGPTVQVLDTLMRVGPDLVLGRKRFRFGAGLVAGANIHSFRRGVDAGGRVDWYVGLPMHVSLGRPKRGARVHLFTEAGILGSRLEHRAPNRVVLWDRAAWMIQAGVSVSYGWRIL